MENPEEILHSLEEFSKMKPKDIPRELEEYLCYVAKTGNPVYQWPTIKSLFREKLINVITEFYESCPSVDIPPCPNVDIFNYELMKNFILEKLDTFSSAPFTVQRICELLTTPRKEYNRIDKYMRALEKNILVVSTTEPGRRSTENGESIMNGIESEHLPESSNSSHDINVEEMDETPTWPRVRQVTPILFQSNESESQAKSEAEPSVIQESFENEPKISEMPSSSTVTEPEVQQETVITCTAVEDLEQPYVSIEPIPLESLTTTQEEKASDSESDVSVTITAVPAGVQQRRSSMERVGSSECETITVEKPSETNVPEEVTQAAEQRDLAIEDQILATVSSTETVEEPVKTEEIPEQTEKLDTAVQEETGIENISPENSSLSPEVLQADVSSETEKVQQLDEQIPETTVKEPEITKDAEEETGTEQPLAPNSTEEVPVETPTEEDIAKEPSDLKKIPVLQNDLEDDNTVDSTTEKEEMKEVYEETKSETESDTKEVPLEPDSSEIEETKNESEQTPMEIDISETEIEKKLVSVETPTSVDTTL